MTESFGSDLVPILDYGKARRRPLLSKRTWIFISIVALWATVMAVLAFISYSGSFEPQNVIYG
jgi:hypothetical protein